MSFYVEFHARPEHVEETLHLHVCPKSVKDFILMAVSGLAEHSIPEDKMAIIEVVADGHLCDGHTSYEVSSATIKVKRLLIAK